MDPDLAHDDIGGALALDCCSRGPDMFGEVAQTSCGGTVGLEDGLVAEQDGDGDGQDNGEQPMLGGRGAVGLESAADGVGCGEAWWFSRTAREQLLAHAPRDETRSRRDGEQQELDSKHSPTQRIEEVPDHSAPRPLSKGIPRLEQQQTRVCDALDVDSAVWARGAALSSDGPREGEGEGESRARTGAERAARRRTRTQQTAWWRRQPTAGGIKAHGSSSRGVGGADVEHSSSLSSHACRASPSLLWWDAVLPPAAATGCDPARRPACVPIQPHPQSPGAQPSDLSHSTASLRARRFRRRPHPQLCLAPGEPSATAWAAQSPQSPTPIMGPRHG